MAPSSTDDSGIDLSGWRADFKFAPVQILTCWALIPEFQLLAFAEQAARYLRGEICRGRWTGTIPGKNLLAVGLGLDHQTVEAALRLLEAEELLAPQGVGCPRRVVGPPDDRASRPLRVGLLWDAGDLLQPVFSPARSVPWTLPLQSERF